jgi:hypothetical protein
VALSARIIDVNTGEILVVANGRGESSRSGTALLGAGGGSGTAAGGFYDMTSSNFGATLIGEATTQAVTAVGRTLDSNAQKMPTRVVKVEGLVADATDDTVVLNVGARAGVKVGDRIAITRASREIRDPATGKVIRRVEEPVTTVTITEVDDASAVGKYQGTKPKVGDVAKSVSQ